MTDFAYSREVARRSGSNFYHAFFFMPKPRREGILAVYAFSRLVDDAVDEAPDEGAARREIALWRERLDACYNGGLDRLSPAVSHPILPEIREIIGRYSLPKACFADLITGMEMDLEKKTYASFAELETYCYHVAGTIGLMCNGLFGVGPADEEARRHAILLGTAFQLTNVIRDVGVDARLGRIYLPADEMERFGVSREDVLSGREGAAFFDLMRHQWARAEDYYARAAAALPAARRRKILPAAVMSEFYHAILLKIREENFPVLRRKVSLSKLHKMWLIGKVLAQSL